MKRRVFLAVVLFFTFGISFAIQAEDKAYIGLILPFNSIEGDFDGETVLVGSNEIILVPKVEDSDDGWGIVLGGGDKTGVLEMSYLKSKHEVSWYGAKSSAEFNLISMDFKSYFLVSKQMQPYLLFGWVPYAWLTVKDGSAASSSVGNATFVVPLTGLNLGGGLTFNLHHRVSLNAGIIYRLLYFGSAKGVKGEFAGLKDYLSGSGLNYVAGIAFAL